ncbi:unnamed protein product, partial [Onchocerca ochengi]
NEEERESWSERRRKEQLKCEQSDVQPDLGMHDCQRSIMFCSFRPTSSEWNENHAESG